MQPSYIAMTSQVDMHILECAKDATEDIDIMQDDVRKEVVKMALTFK